MLRQAKAYQLADQSRPADDTFPHVRLIRRARLYPIGTQAAHRSRMFHFRMAYERPSQADADSEFIIRARRRSPMQHTTASETWTANSDATNSWAANSDPSNSWADNAAVGSNWTDNT